MVGPTLLNVGHACQLKLVQARPGTQQAHEKKKDKGFHLPATAASFQQPLRNGTETEPKRPPHSPIPHPRGIIPRKPDHQRKAHRAFPSPAQQNKSTTSQIVSAFESTTHRDCHNVMSVHTDTTTTTANIFHVVGVRGLRMRGGEGRGLCANPRAPPFAGGRDGHTSSPSLPPRAGGIAWPVSAQKGAWVRRAEQALAPFWSSPRRSACKAPSPPHPCHSARASPPGRAPPPCVP